MSPGKDPLHRRRISKALQAIGKWVVKTNVDGNVLVRPKRGLPEPDFITQVRSEVEKLGYKPDVKWWTDPAGTRWVRVHTPETLDQIGRGAHGA